MTFVSVEAVSEGLDCANSVRRAVKHDRKLWHKLLKFEESEKRFSPRLFKEVQAELRSRRIKYRVVGDELVFSVKKGMHPLNKLAKVLYRKYGIKLVLSLAVFKNASAQYQRDENIINLPFEVIFAPKTAMAIIIHEIRHYKIFRRFKCGDCSMANGWLVSKTGETIDIEELFTYALELRILQTSLSSVVKGSLDEILIKDRILVMREKLRALSLELLQLANGALEEVSRDLPALHSNWREQIDGHKVRVIGMEYPSGRTISMHRAPIPYAPSSPVVNHIEIFFKKTFLWFYSSDLSGDSIDQVVGKLKQIKELALISANFSSKLKITFDSESRKANEELTKSHLNSILSFY